jgi:glutathione S-transferase
VLVLYQAEWCPFSSAVRERLTELGVDYIVRQVEPRPEDRTAVGEIPTLVADDGQRYEGSDAIFDYLDRFEPWPHERGHRERYAEHEEARRSDAAGRILGRRINP